MGKIAQVVGYPELRVSESGEVYRIAYKVMREGKELEMPSKHIKKYFNDKYQKNYIRGRIFGKAFNMPVDRIVLNAFSGTKGSYCRHINGDLEDDRLENLEWTAKKKRGKVFESNLIAVNFSERLVYFDEDEVKEDGFNMSQIKRSIKRGGVYAGYFWGFDDGQS